MVRIKSKKGSTMVEAALVFPILIFVVVTVVGFCTFMSDKILAGSKAAIIAKKHAVSNTGTGKNSIEGVSTDGYSVTGNEGMVSDVDVVKNVRFSIGRFIGNSQTSIKRAHAEAVREEDIILPLEIIKEASRNNE